MEEMLKYSLPIAGVIVGAGLQFFFSKKNELKKQQNLLKTVAYTDFLKAIAGLAISQRFSDKEREKEFLILLSDAKSRISVYGSDKVVKEVANFWRIGPILNNPKSNKAFTLVVMEMRNDNLSFSNVELNDISQLLVSVDLE